MVLLGKKTHSRNSRQKDLQGFSSEAKACLGGAIFFLRQAHECIDRRTKEAVHLGVKCLKL